MYSTKKIIKNFAALTASEIVSKAIGVISTAYLARIILPDGYGVIGFSIALVSYFSNIIIFGGDIIAMRDVSRDHTKIGYYFTNIISFRIIISVLLVLIIFPLVPLISTDLRLEYILKIILLSLFINTFSTNFIYQAIEKMEIIAVSNLLKSVFLLLGYVLFVHGRTDVYNAAWVFTVSSVSVSLMLFFYTHHMISKFKWNIDFSFISYLLKESYPLLISSIAITVYYNLDIIMLGYMKTDSEVGIYNAAYRIFLIGTLPINLILQSFFPQISKIFRLPDNTFWATFKKYMYSQLIMGLAVGISMYCLAEMGIFLIYGKEFLAASGATKILAMNVVLVAVNVTIGNPLTAWGKQMQYSFVIVGGAVVNIILNFILIPKYSFNGAALATLFSEFVVFIGMLFIFNLTLQSRKRLINEI